MKKHANVGIAKANMPELCMAFSRRSDLLPSINVVKVSMKLTRSQLFESNFEKIRQFFLEFSAAWRDEITNVFDQESAGPTHVFWVSFGISFVSCSTHNIYQLNINYSMP